MAGSAIIPIILSGGAGARLWPLSREERPKQFLRFGSKFSLIQETVLRCFGAPFDERPIILSGEHQRFLVAEHMREINIAADIILEPARRDSCAAIAAGCVQALHRSPDAIVCVIAADHKIPDAEAFRLAVESARVDARAGYLTTFGITPEGPATGYGYIKRGAQLRAGGSALIEKFVEKPDSATAANYIRDGYLWNSGNLLFSAALFISELQKFSPEILSAVSDSFENAKRDTDFTWLELQSFSSCPRISVDYAVMEKTARAAVFPVDYAWSDVGTWDAIYSLLPLDKHLNGLEGHALVVNGERNFVHSAGVLTALVGVDDLIVVASSDAILVTKRGSSENVKTLVEHLKVYHFKEAE